MAQAIDEQSQPPVEASKLPQPGQKEENNAQLNEKRVVDESAPAPDPARPQTDGERTQRHAFCSPVLIFLSAIGSLFAGMLSLSAAAGQGMSKFYWHIPVLYGDKTTREWPEITGFRSGCAAGGKSLIYGLYDGITGVVVLPYKGAKGAGIKGFGIGILHGIGGLFFKPLSGLWAFIGHPIFGLHKHFSKHKGDYQQESVSAAV
ncbi:hypothetical protein E0Z10_g5157 [Xylaria hypoxylon]|uniref:Uncharacterized protein n=1 Tax=Xylaria hypoxylon TaxID=37992 RepID=A0A4Z0YWS7_9PEZI|nr:hypothetical protein E0Z10_g5157 [Xylaria hypoxylon]